MRGFSRLLIGGAMVLLIASVASAAITTGHIRITVQQEDGTAIKGAQVTATTADSITKRTAQTNAAGEAILPGLDPSDTWTVETIASGFNGARNDNVLVKTGETTTIVVTLRLSTKTEEVTVTAETPLVDVTSAISGQEITLELTESLPTGRSYQNYLQLVPGVLPDDPDNPGNPASRSGLNYRDIGGDLGESRDNFYYIEGINVTDNVQGLFGANLNTEIIQEQKVITGGIPAEYAGAPGLISSVVTKFGGNEFAGSVNYFFQSDSLVADNENQGEADFSTFDSAFTIGGPIVRDKVWFFASYRKFNREDDVTSQDTDEFLRTVEDDRDQYYGKITWQASTNDRLSATILGDPTDQTGLTDRDLLNTRDESREIGGDRFSLNYQRVLGSAVLDLAFGKHNGELSRLSAIDEQTNDVIFQADQPSTLALQQLGGFGENIIDERDTEFYKAAAEIFVDSSWAQHTIKAGVEFEEHINFRDRNLVADASGVRAEFASVDAGMAAFCNNPANDCGATWSGAIDANFLATGSFTDSNWDVFNTSDFGGLIDTIDALPTLERDEVYLMLDTNTDGTITAAEASLAMLFDSALGNPNGQINYNRDLQTAAGSQNTTSEGLTLYLQDTMQFGKLTANIGVRAEKWEHFATTGENIYEFDWTIAPRISVVYDLKGDGKQKLSAYYGRYYDPIRNNMTNFAGTLTGRITEEQVWVNDRWLSFRTRGGPVVQDAFFSPTTETPFTDEIELGYMRDLGRNMSIEANVIMRETDDILEDYDLALYAFATDGSTDYTGPLDDPDSLWLGLDYFGYDVNPGSNFVIGTLEGGKRDWDGVELIFRKRYADNWQALAAYTYADASGNTNSDSNADFQGDVLYLDPRAPFQTGNQPGSVEHLLKAGGSYSWDNGFKVGGSFRWNSGTIASRTELRFRRNLPIRRDATDPFTFANIPVGDERWLEADAVGSRENPDWSSLDVRFQYNRQFNNRLGGEFFIDVFNLLDDQAAIRTQDLVAGDGLTNFGDEIRWVPPRRYFIGARLSF